MRGGALHHAGVLTSEMFRSVFAKVRADLE
jgi:hypothetical protein